ncbi:MAG: hypothetical protein JWN38_112 [Candidatus Saccharibacteria bacterium]|nr:hypothetical protein [Candidatus Saccharibacteria bacterium]
MTMSTRATGKSRASEAGFAALVIAIVMVTVLSLLTIGFATLMRREQRAALDKQLANAAFYAAESGINDGVAAIRHNYVANKTTCGPDHTNSYLNNNVIDNSSSNPVIYSCLLIDQAPSDIRYSSVGSDDSDSKVASITGADPVTRAPVPISKLTISWMAENETQNFAPTSWFNSGKFPTAANWKGTDGGLYTGVVRAELTPLPTSGLSRDTMAAKMFAAYFYPAAGTGIGSDDYNNSAGTNAGKIYNGNCTNAKAPYYCSYSITGLTESSYLLRLNSLYNNSSVKIEAYGVSGAQLRIIGAQTMVDSTGNARGVLKRLQVRVPNQKTVLYPQYGLETLSGICKKLTVTPTESRHQCSGALTVPDLATGPPPTIPVIPTGPVSSDIGPLPFDLPSQYTLKNTTKKVFAHYIPTFPISIDNQDPSNDYYARNFLTVNGESGKHAAYGGYIRDRPYSRSPLPGNWALTDMKTEITRASDAGIDGFTTDVLSVSNNTWPRVLNLVQAASELNNGFKILFMPDGTTLGNTADSLADTLAGVAKGPYKNGLKFLPDGRLVVSPFNPEKLSKGSSDTVAYWTEFVHRMSADGVPVAFIPCSLNYTNATKFAAISYGYSIWGNRNPGQEGSQAGLSTSAHAAGKIWMQPVSLQDERPYAGLFYEAGNSENFRVTWQAAIDGNADWVQIPTWDDFYENSEIEPSPHLGWSVTDLASYYLTKFKLGVAPTIVRDVVYISHRRQPVNAAPTGPQTLIMKPQTACGMPLPCLIVPRDTVEALTFLTKPTTVKVSVGGTVTTYTAPAGVSAKLVPLKAGTVSAELDRSDGSTIKVTSLYPVSNTLEVQDLHYVFATSGRTGVYTAP